MSAKLQSVLNDPVRLQELADLRLLDTPPEIPFDRLTRAASQALNAPIALVSLVDDHRQFFKSSCGLAEPLASVRETPLSHSFCKHVVASSTPLVVGNAHVHPLVCGSMAVTELGVVAYLGMPLALPHGMTLGSFCVVDTEPRQWSSDDRQIMTALASAVVSEIALRSAHHHIRDLQRTIADQHTSIHTVQLLAHLGQQLLLKDGHGLNGDAAHTAQDSLERLTKAVHHLLSADSTNSAGTDSLSLDQLREKLTDSQIEVFDLLMRGLQTKEIARYLGRSPRTIEVHRSNILKRLQISSISNLLKQLLARPESH